VKLSDTAGCGAPPDKWERGFGEKISAGFGNEKVPGKTRDFDMFCQSKK